MHTSRIVHRIERLARAIPGAGLAVLVCTMGPPPSERFTSERMAAHTRVLKACGRKKACLVKPPARAADVVPPGAEEALSLTRARWKESEFDDVTVWIAPGVDAAYWRESNRYMVRDAFHEWMAAGAPVRFTFVADSVRADVHVLWRDSLPDARAGQVTRMVDQRGWVRSATIEMNTRNVIGGEQDSATVHAVALHEVGHLLGLEHSPGEKDIMSVWVTETRLSRRDRAAMHALYDAYADKPTR